MTSSSLLSTEELLLLVNLMYLFDEPGGLCVSVEDRNRLLDAIRNNERLMDLRILALEEKSPLAGSAAAFLNDKTGEAIIVFRGTGKGEWRDNFLGGAATNAADGVSTTQQLGALAWYHSLDLADWYVTVTGHSKGGNKAKYLAIVEGSVDRCVSFDGQGFSDEFVRHYAKQIADRQKIVENHNLEYDFVNILLNDVGERFYYKRQIPLQDGFLANHCANGFFKFREDGSFYVERAPEGQAKEMDALDRMINRILRSIPEKDREKAMDLIGTQVQAAMNGEGTEERIRLFLQKGFPGLLPRLVGYAALGAITGNDSGEDLVVK